MAKQVSQREIDAAYEEEQEIEQGMYEESPAQENWEETIMGNVEYHEEEIHVVNQEELQAYYGSLQEELDDAKGESRMYMGRAEDYISEKYGKQSLEFEAHEDAVETVADAFDEVEEDAKKTLKNKIALLIKENEQLKESTVSREEYKKLLEETLEQNKLSYKIKQKFKVIKDYIVAIKDHTKQYAVDVKDDVFKSVDDLSVRVVQSSIDKNEKLAEIERQTIRELEAEKSKMIGIAEKEKQHIRELSLEQGKAKQGIKNIIKLTFHMRPDHSEIADFSPKAKKKIAAIDSQLKEVVSELDKQILEAGTRLAEKEGIIADKQDYIEGINQYWQEKKVERDNRKPTLEEQIKTMTEKVQAENEQNRQQNPNRQKNHDDVEH